MGVLFLDAKYPFKLVLFLSVALREKEAGEGGDQIPQLK